MLALGDAATSNVRVYLVGGTTAVLIGWRASTVDVDMVMEPEDGRLLHAISELKNSLQINVELASPPDFVPELEGWRERSPFVLREGRVTVRHFDLYSQALSKIERGFSQDLEDVASMVREGLVDPRRARAFFDATEDLLHRYPAIDAGAFRASVDRALGLSRRPSRVA